MENRDVVLIQRILEGDDTAFARLVNKYQKQVHALVWRKIGDFHIAEEITQDTFLKAYQKLNTLKNPNQFSGWLYVIATRLCYAWFREKRIETEPLEDMDTDMVEETAYSQFVANEQAKDKVDEQRAVVKKLLSKLQESERTVMVLHYFGEMTCAEISRFLGVSPSAIKSRLSRARQRLKKEEPMIREVLSNFQISTNLTESIMRQIEHLNPGVPSGGNPFLPWVLAASGAIMIVLLLGMGSKQLARFQQPYTLDMQSEIAVELIDAPIVHNIVEKVDSKKIGKQSNTSGPGNGNGQEPNQGLSDSVDYTQWQLPEGAKARLGKGEIIGNIAFSPEGNRLAVTSAIGIWIYDVRPGKEKELNLITGFRYHPSAVAFSPDGTTIASGSQNGSVQLWNVRTGTLITKLLGHPWEITTIAFSHDGNTLATGNGILDRTHKEVPEIRIWNIQTKELITILKGHLDSITDIAFSPDDKTIASASADETARLWNAHTGQYITTLKGPSKLKSDISTITSIAYSPDGKTIATGCLTNSVRLWNTQNGEYIKTIRGRYAGIDSLAYSPDGTSIAAGSYKKVHLLDVHNRKHKLSLIGHTGEVTSVDFSPFGDTLAAVGENDNAVKLWNTQTGELRTTLAGHQSSVTAIAYSPDGNTIATTRWNRDAYLWDVHTRKLKTTLKGPSYAVDSITYSPDGKTIVTTTAQKAICLWDAETGNHIGTLLGHTEWVASAAFSPDGNILASGSRDKTIRLWDTNTKEHIATITGHTREVTSVAFSPDGKTLASGSYDKTVRLWEIHSGKHIATLEGHHASKVSEVVFSPDSTTVASAGATESLILWNTCTGKIIAPQSGHTNCITSVAFSSDGTILATGSRDGTVRLWQAQTGTHITTHKGHYPNLAIYLAFSPNGNTLASGSGDGTVLFWEIR